MEVQVQELRRLRDQSYFTYKTYDFATDIMEDLTKCYDSPVGSSYPFTGKRILAIPAPQGTIDLRTEQQKESPIFQYQILNINIQPNPLNVARSMNVSVLPNPIMINMTFPVHFDSESSKAAFTTQIEIL